MAVTHTPGNINPPTSPEKVTETAAPEIPKHVSFVDPDELDFDTPTTDTTKADSGNFLRSTLRRGALGGDIIDEPTEQSTAEGENTNTDDKPKLVTTIKPKQDTPDKKVTEDKSKPKVGSAKAEVEVDQKSGGNDQPKTVMDKIRANRRALMLGGGLTAATAVFGAFQAYSSSRTGEHRVPITTAPADAGKNSGDPKGAAAYSPEINIGTGVIDPSRILPGEKFITAKVLDGQEVKVPYVRDPSNPSSAAESVMALFACALTTEDAATRTACLDALTSDKGLQQAIMKERENFIVNPRRYSDTPQNVQMEVFDNQRNPAQFTKRIDPNGDTRITLSGGELYWASEDSPRWQNPDAHDPARVASWPVKELELSIATTSNGHEVTGLTWSYNRKQVRIPN